MWATTTTTTIEAQVYECKGKRRQGKPTMGKTKNFPPEVQLLASKMCRRLEVTVVPNCLYKLNQITRGGWAPASTNCRFVEAEKLRLLREQPL
jgi:hypothetical protein